MYILVIRAAYNLQYLEAKRITIHFVYCTTYDNFSERFRKTSILVRETNDLDILV